MNFKQYEKKVNVEFLNKHLSEIIELNIAFPYSLVMLIKDNNLHKSAHKLYIMRARENVNFYNNMKHIDSRENEDFYDYEFRKLVEYTRRVPKFRELIR